MLIDAVKGSLILVLFADQVLLREIEDVKLG